MTWTADYPIKNLPDNVREAFVCEAVTMYKELQQNRFRYELEDHPEARYIGHKRKEVTQRNPEWYSQLWHEYSSSRKDRKRGNPERNIKKTTGMLRKKHQRDNILYSKHSKIERKRVLSSLNRIQQQKDGTYLGSRFWYDAIFREAIKERLLIGYEDIEHGPVPPDIDVVRHFTPKRLEGIVDDEVPFLRQT